MTITKIRRQKNGRYAIYADGQYVLSVDEQTFLQSSLQKDQEISQAQLDELAEAAGDHYADDRAMMILSYRDHSSEELRRKLTRTVGADQAQRATEHMQQLGLVNDADYAAKLADELLNRRLMGADRALFEMTRRGVDRETARQAIEQQDTDPQEHIKEFLQKKYPGGINDEKERRRAVAALSRGGFRWDDIRRALNGYEEDF